MDLEIGFGNDTVNARQGLKDDANFLYRAKDGNFWTDCVGYILDLISSCSALSLSMSVGCEGHPIPRPSVSFGLGIC